MKNMQLSIDKALDFVSKSDIDAYSKAVAQASVALEDGTGKGNDFLGWLHLPSSITEEMIQDIEETARQLRSTCDAVVVAGIGGSYLGAKAVIEALSDSFSWLKKETVLSYCLLATTSAKTTLPSLPSCFVTADSASSTSRSLVQRQRLHLPSVC